MPAPKINSIYEFIYMFKNVRNSYKRTKASWRGLVRFFLLKVFKLNCNKVLQYSFLNHKFIFNKKNIPININKIDPYANSYLS